MTTALILAVVALLIATAGLCLVVLAQAEALKSQRPTEQPRDGLMNLARALLAPDVDVPLDRTHHDDIDLTDAELDAWDQIRDRHWKP